MPPARCPVCNDIININNTVKLYQGIICPTCLTRISVVSLDPLELELPLKSSHKKLNRQSRSGNKRHSRKIISSQVSEAFGSLDDLEYIDEDFDDYLIERRQRNKQDRQRQRRSNLK